MRKLIYILCFSSLAACAQEKNQHATQVLKQETKTEQKQETMNTNNENSTATPESVIKALMEAMTANDAEKIRSLFNENASQAYGEGGSSKSGEAFFSWLTSDIIDRKGHVDNAKLAVNGNEVVVTGQYSSEGYTNKANFLFSVENGEIMSWRMRY